MPRLSRNDRVGRSTRMPRLSRNDSVWRVDRAVTENGDFITPFEKESRGYLPILLYEPPFSKGGIKGGFALKR